MSRSGPGVDDKRSMGCSPVMVRGALIAEGFAQFKGDRAARNFVIAAGSGTFAS